MGSAYCPESIIAPDQCPIARSNSIAALRGMYRKQEYFLFIYIYIYNSSFVCEKLVLFPIYEHPQ